jgi:hypothetical protein
MSYKWAVIKNRLTLAISKFETPTFVSGWRTGVWISAPMCIKKPTADFKAKNSVWPKYVLACIHRNIHRDDAWWHKHTETRLGGERRGGSKLLRGTGESESLLQGHWWWSCPRFDSAQRTWGFLGSHARRSPSSCITCRLSPAGALIPRFCPESGIRTREGNIFTATWEGFKVKFQVLSQTYKSGTQTHHTGYLPAFNSYDRISFSVIYRTFRITGKICLRIKITKMEFSFYVQIQTRCTQ